MMDNGGGIFMKKILFIIIILLAAIVLVYCIFNRGVSVAEKAKLKSSNITKIVFYDGRDRHDTPLTVNDKQKINEFIGYLDKCIIEKHETDDQVLGCASTAVFYHNKKELIEITFGENVTINKTKHYKVVKNNLVGEIDQFLHSIDSTWKVKYLMK